MSSWRENLPLGLFIPFILIILVELIVSYGFDYYKSRLSTQINNLESQLNRREEGLSDKLAKTDSYFIFSQVINIVEILKNKNSPLTVVRKFTPLVPNFVNVQSVDINMETSEITMGASVPNLISYLRVLNYFRNHPKLELKNQPAPAMSNNQVYFQMVFALKPAFFE